MKRFFCLVLALALGSMSAAAFAAEWTGQIVKKDGQLWFQSGAKTLKIGNPDKATGHEGQNVKIAGTADDVTSTVTIDSLTVTP